MFLTPLFYYLPKAVLAAIIMVAVFGLIDIAEVKRLWRIKRVDLGLLAVTFLGTLAGNGVCIFWVQHFLQYADGFDPAVTSQTGGGVITHVRRRVLGQFDQSVQRRLAT